MSNHIFRYENGQKLPAVMHCQGKADHFRQDGRSARPGFDDLIASRSLGFVHFPE
jgi:hypothetical protein